MAVLKFRDQDGAWQYAPSLKFKNGNDVFEITNGLKYKDKNGVWHKVNICGTKPIDPVFANNDWKQVVEACRVRQVPDTWSVGDQMTMNINGTDYLIDIIGKDHDDYADGSGKAPLTFLMHDCYSTTYAMNSTMSNRTGWESSALRTENLPAILSTMPNEVQSAIREVTKLTIAGNNVNSVRTTSDKLFLLSETEVFGSAAYSYPVTENQYAYYAMGNSKVKKVNGAASIWWLRTPAANSTEFVTVNSNGTATSKQASTSNGVAFAFCF